MVKGFEHPNCILISITSHIAHSGLSVLKCCGVISRARNWGLFT